MERLTIARENTARKGGDRLRQRRVTAVISQAIVNRFSGEYSESQSHWMLLLDPSVPLHLSDWLNTAVMLRYRASLSSALYYSGWKFDFQVVISAWF
jgi:hypothetical protein